MSNRKKIKVRYPITRDSKTLQIEKYLKVNMSLAYSAQVGINELQREAHALKNAIKEDNAIWHRELCQQVDIVVDVTKRMQGYISELFRKFFSSPSRATLLCLIQSYGRENRVMSVVLKHTTKRMQYTLSQLRQTASICTLNVKEPLMSKTAFTHALVCAEMAGYIQGVALATVGEWFKYSGDKTTINAGVMITNQARDIRKPIAKVIDILSGHTEGKEDHFRFESEEKWWSQFLKASNAIHAQMAIIIENGSLALECHNEVITDYTNYYIAATCMAYEQYGVIPQQVQQDIIRHEGGAEILKQMMRMVKATVKAVGKTDDMWDYIDELDNHQWKVRQRLTELNNGLSDEDKKRLSLI